jgi:DNA-binding NarL/FixJ family response regulator
LISAFLFQPFSCGSGLQLGVDGRLLPVSPVPLSPRLFIVEDQELFRRMLVDLCAKQFHFPVAGEAGTFAEALRLAPRTRFDVLLLDLQLPDGDGCELARRLFVLMPGLRVLALTSRRDEVTVTRIRELGIQGFVDKAAQVPTTLRAAIEAVAAGRVFHTEALHRVQQAMRDDPAAFAKVLSEREQELLGQLGRGFSNEEIAADLGLAAGTVHSHRRNIMKKLGLATQAELIRYALRKGFVRIDAGGI